MNSADQGANVVDEFKRFLAFAQNLWAALAGVSALFPLSNALVRVIPLARWGEDGGLAYLSAPLVTGIATLACLFVILWTFGRRDRFAGLRRQRSIRRQAAWSFALGIAALVGYLAGYFAVKNDFYFLVFGWHSGDLRRVFGDIVLLLGYSLFFALTTRAFMLLAMIEFFGRGRHDG